MKTRKSPIVIILILVLIIGIIAAVFSGCNKSITPGSYEFKGVHVSDCSGNCRDLTVKSWHNNDIGIELNTEEAGPIFCSEGTYIIYRDKCPICSGKESN